MRLGEIMAVSVPNSSQPTNQRSSQSLPRRPICAGAGGQLVGRGTQKLSLPAGGAVELRSLKLADHLAAAAAACSVAPVPAASLHWAARERVREATDYTERESASSSSEPAAAPTGHTHLARPQAHTHIHTVLLVVCPTEATVHGRLASPVELLRPSYG